MGTLKPSTLVEPGDLINLDAVLNIENEPRNPTPPIGTAGERGFLQITPIALDEFNRFNKKSPIAPEGLDNVDTNVQVARFLFNVAIPDVIRKKGFKVTPENLIISWNAGNTWLGTPFNDLPKVTQRFITRYKALTGVRAEDTPRRR